MKKIISLVCTALMAALMLSGCNMTEVVGKDVASAGNASGASASNNSALSGTLKFAGSSSMADVMAALGEEFKAQNPDVTVTVDQQGSGSAIPALADGTAQIGNLSRDVKPEENADGKYTVIDMAIDGIVVAVNPANKVASLTIAQVRDIFEGKITNWKDVGGDNTAIYIVGREEGSGTRDGFESIIGAAGKCQYGVLLKETGDVLSKVSSEKAAIGYVSFASVSSKIKPVSINSVAASDSTIADGTYKLQRSFVQAYRKNTTDPLVLAYLEFLKTDKAQSIIKAQKEIPVEFWKQ